MAQPVAPIVTKITMKLEIIFLICRNAVEIALPNEADETGSEDIRWQTGGKWLARGNAIQLRQKTKVVRVVEIYLN